jgi:hypothetical protein
MVTKRFGRLDSPETQYQRVKQRFQGFADAVPVVPLGKPNLSRQRTLPSYAPKELLDERYTRELGQANSIGGNMQISRPARHCYQTTLLVRFHCKGQNNLWSRY